MSDKTEIFKVNFFLVNKKQTISVKNKMLIGRAEGDIIIPDANLSSRHCELIPRGLNLFVKDLKSTNGVYVNKMQIDSNKEVRLNFGDVLRVGNEEFTFQDTDLVKTEGTIERRAEGGATLSGKLAYFLSFFSVQKEIKGIYFLMILLTALSLIMNLSLTVPLSDDVLFLSKLYEKLLVTNGIKNILLIWLMCLGHAYILSAWIKSNIVRGIAVIPLFVIVINLVNFVDGPAWYVKNYVENRYKMLEMEKNKSPNAITDLKAMVNAKTKFQNAFIKIDSMVLDPERDALRNDYSASIKIIDKKIDSLKQRPDR